MKIITRNSVFNDNTLNIFSDASIKVISDDLSVGCSGAISYIGDYVIDEKIMLIKDTTNMNAEVKAIELGIDQAILYKDKVKNINLFSDSKVSIYGLREWVFNWVKCSTDQLCKPTGEPVANQSIYLSIIYKILENNLRINFYHQNGHINLKNQKSINQAKNTFINTNYIDSDIEDDLIKEISLANFIIDRDTRYAVKNSNFKSMKEINNNIAYHPFNVEKYAELINAPFYK